MRLFPLLGALAAFAVPSSSRAVSCSTTLAAPRTTAQLVTVTAATAASTTATMQLWARSHGCWRAAAGPWPVHIGFAGVSTHHREGDGTTPAGTFAVGPVLYGVAPSPGVHYAYHRLACGDWWDEDPASPAYNSFRHVPCGTRPPFGGSSEALWRSARAYAHFAFVEYNARPAAPGRGSAIFIHVDLGHPTNGCISLAPERLVALLRWLRPAAHPLVAIGTETQLRSS